MEATFVGRDLHGTVYVTPNPHTSFLDDDIFYYVEDGQDTWDEELQPVHPKTISGVVR